MVWHSRQSQESEKVIMDKRQTVETLWKKLRKHFKESTVIGDSDDIGTVTFYHPKKGVEVLIDNVPLVTIELVESWDNQTINKKLSLIIDANEDEGEFCVENLKAMRVVKSK